MLAWCPGSRAVGREAAITGVGTLPMRTVSRQAHGSKCPSVNLNVFNIGHTAPVDERLPLAETFCGIVYHAFGINKTSCKINEL